MLGCLVAKKDVDENVLESQNYSLEMMKRIRDSNQIAAPL